MDKVGIVPWRGAPAVDFVRTAKNRPFEEFRAGLARPQKTYYVVAGQSVPRAESGMVAASAGSGLWNRLRNDDISRYVVGRGRDAAVDDIPRLG